MGPERVGSPSGLLWSKLWDRESVLLVVGLISPFVGLL